MLRDLCSTAEDLREKLSQEAEKLLSNEARETIDKREDQQFYQINPDAPVITWEPSDGDKARGKQIYPASRHNGTLTKGIEYARKLGVVG